jgi:zinc transport system substrate-binding protein
MKARIVLIISACLLAAACGPAKSSSGGRTSVVAAFYPLAFAAQQIGGSDVNVENLTPTGGEPHDLELAPQAVARIERADLVLYLSHGFQPAVSDAVRSARGTKLDALAGLPLHAARNQEASLTADPHVWLDPQLFEKIVTRIGAALHRPAAARALVAKLRTLDAQYRRGLAHCARRDIVTSHAAFGYLAQRYGLQQVAITGIAPESEPTAQQLAHVVDVVRTTHATTVFSEKLLSPRLADTVAREVGAKTAVLDPIEGLTPPEQARGVTYLTLMRQNLEALRKALGCQ